MPLTLYVATTNAGKLRDFAVAARVFREAVNFVSLPGLDTMPPSLEDCDTFEGNARLKAIEYSRSARGLVVIADDSGLEADALGLAPGVRSARYAEDAGFDPAPAGSLSADAGILSTNASGLSIDERNNLLLLTSLCGVPSARRTARYRAVLAAARDGECLACGHGSVAGMILEAPRGSGGFGYDPLFYLPELDRTMAEIDLETKLAISHRGHAMRALLKDLLRLESVDFLLPTRG